MSGSEIATEPLPSEIGNDPLWREAKLTLEVYQGLGYSVEDIEQIHRWEGVIVRRIKEVVR
ncbi:MAG: hypothetical protein GXX95_01360 [Methanomassiliicoccus sp.]|nr:hypothetical protein [Methanomassiliicoccus sp.]